jgi:signal transduction histidine kinase
MSLPSNIAEQRTLRVLHLEDDPNDRKLAEHELKREGFKCEFRFVDNQREFEQAICREEFDLVISDFTLPSYDGKLALAATYKFQPETPFILLSGTIGEERAVQFLKGGAADCVLKENLPRLGPAIQRALLEAKERKARKSAEEALRVLTVQLRALAARAQASREEEQIRISREIHDEFGEALTGQKFGLEWIRQKLEDKNIPREEIFKKVESLKALTDATAKRVRKFCTELRPPILDDLGLTAAIEWQAREFQTRTNIRCEIVQMPEIAGLDNQQTTAMFRIFQEILTNVARHSNASKVRVNLKIENTQLTFQVNDNGKGISQAKMGGGGSLGLLGMRERALSIGGQVLIEGAPGKGTTVTVSIPVRETATTNGKQSK